MPRTLKTTIVFISILFLGCIALGASMDWLAPIKSKDAGVRAKAAAAIVEDYNAKVAALEAVIEENLRDYDMSKSVEDIWRLGRPPDNCLIAASAMSVLGDLRAARAVPVLIKYRGLYVGKPLDGAPGPDSMPALKALSKIGYPSLQPLLDVCKRGGSENYVYTSMVLKMVLGQKMAKAYVESALAEEKKPEVQQCLKELLKCVAD